MSGERSGRAGNQQVEPSQRLEVARVLADEERHQPVLHQRDEVVTFIGEAHAFRAVAGHRADEHVAVMAQRLVRNICNECRESYDPTQTELRSLGLNPVENPNVQLYRGHGCQRCHQGGYKGRKGIFEIFKVDDEIQRMIFENNGARELRIRAREMGMRTLREDGVRKVLAGITTLEEVLRVTMGDED